MDNNTNKTPEVAPVITEQPVTVSSDLDAKVSDAEAQRKAAVWVEIFYAAMFLMVGAILTIYALVWFWGPSGFYNTSQIGNGTPGTGSDGWPSNGGNSMFAMGIVGVGLLVWGICSIVLAATMQVENKSNHKISNFLGIWNWFTLNPYSWSLIRQSNGYVSKKQKEKMAKAAAAAKSDDSVDVKADVTEDQQAEAQQIA